MLDFKMRVLVVDDMMTMRKLVSKSLKEIGLTDLIEASDGAKAWEALTSSEPGVGLIVSDWNMPNSSGIDLLKRVRSERRFKDLPFLLVTAEAEAVQVAEALQAAVSGYVVKPFSSETLKRQIESIFKKIAA